MAVDYFLKIDGIPGESKDKKHKDTIQLESWSWGESNSGSASQGGGMGSGKVSMQDFHFTMTINKSTPKLMLACAQGSHIKEATLTCRKAGGKEAGEYLIIKFSDFLVSSYQTGGHQGDTIGADSCSFNFSKIDLVYNEQKPDGTVGGNHKMHYDLKANTGG